MEPSLMIDQDYSPLSTKTARTLLALAAASALWACGDDDSTVRSANDAGHPLQQQHDAGSHTSAHEDAGELDDAGATAAKLSFFVTSDTSKTGKLGGLAGADARCSKLAAAIGAQAKTWHAYLSVEHADTSGGAAIDARDRIGHGPWYNAKGALLAKDLDALHARTGDPNVFLDEHGAKINGHWQGSPTPVEHDVLTGSTADGKLLAGETCADWTSDDASLTAQVGHTDGLGPDMNPAPPYNSWNSSHANGGCNDTAPLGGAGRLYCFALE
jgi:hypothetical protein